MSLTKFVRGAAAWAFVACCVAPAGASTFSRVALDDLVAGNSTVIVGKAVEAHSYWNEPNTLILTDVRVVVSEVLKGKLVDREITVTLPGGTVGDQTVELVGGAELVPGSSYVLFLQEGDLPGAKGVRFVRDHSQGVFEVKPGKSGLRAVSQAVHMQLLPDVLGNKEAPGGLEGVPFSEMKKQVLNVANRPLRVEVKR